MSITFFAKDFDAATKNDRDYAILRVQHVDDASARRLPHAGLASVIRTARFPYSG
jgi:hypothetical protein